MLKSRVWGVAGTFLLAYGLGLTGCDQSSPATPADAAEPQAATQPAKVSLGPPPVEFEPPVLDLGIVRPNQRAHGTIYIHNTSDKPLRIRNTVASCTCTSINLKNTPLAPGERVPMKVDYNPASALGDKTSGVRVFIDGYDMVQIDIKALVTLEVFTEPTYISGLREGQSTLLKGEYTVASRDNRPFRILAVNSGPVPYADFDPQRDQPRNSYRLNWDFTIYDPQTCADAAGNKMPGWVIVETDHPECPVVDLEVRHECVRRPRPSASDTWHVLEKRMLVGGITPSSPAEFELVVKWLQTAKVRDDLIKTVVSESDQFAAELAGVEQTHDGMICRIRVTPAPEHRGLIYGTVRVHSARQSGAFVIIGTAPRE